MRKVSIVGFALLAVTAGCSFHIGSDPEPVTPQAAPPARPAAAAPAPATSLSGTPIGRRKGPVPAPGTTPAPPTTPPAASGIPVLAGTNVFGSGTPDPAGWKGTFFVIPAGTKTMPPLASSTPGGVLFAHELNIPQKAMTGGFPGIDPARNDNFAIRWEAPLIVDTEADYTFRIVSDDGAIVNIDGTLILDNDGVHSPQEKTGPVHLVKGTHAITVDYFQSSAFVALQLFCKKAGGPETICPTHLL